MLHVLALPGSHVRAILSIQAEKFSESSIDLHVCYFSNAWIVKKIQSLNKNSRVHVRHAANVKRSSLEFGFAKTSCLRPGIYT
jgi:hypothetical protein